MVRIIAIDPSGTGTTGICLINGKEIEFKECKEKDWRKHYDFITALVKTFKPSLLLFENTNFINSRNRDSLNLIRLLGALECLSIKQVDSINVLKVKELSKLLLKGQVKIADLEYLVGRGKGWMWKGERIVVHQLEAYLVYWLWKKSSTSA
ncbi:MAG: hypothetical protein mread185_000255 [Mycoplasmataceae bacterium]|nr:MAG: hypothetical protein mread185_000255 [Mycoplasmataceae bacterium]